MTLHHGDCLAVMATMPDASVDAIVTDPPYGLGFMGKAWDHGVPGVPFWAEMLRVLKPGGHLLSFGGTRTMHRITTAIEDAGFDIRDTLVWAYASGFPKSLDVSKAIDKAAGAERERRLVPTKRGNLPEQAGPIALGASGMHDESEPATDAARKWNGWGTALKPAWEPIVMARKPLRGTVAANVLEYGTGAINVDGCRIGTTVETWPQSRSYAPGQIQPGGVGITEATGPVPAGRWPANVILTDPIFDGGVEGVVGGGQAGGGFGTRGARDGGLDYGYGATMEQVGYGDTGTYSRFFILPKAARSDREPVVRGTLEEQDDDVDGTFGLDAARPHTKPDYQYQRKARANHHPTVKPTELMRHLVRLVTPPGGTVLDPFLGSGTTAIAAELEGFAWIGIEREAEYVTIANARLNGTQRGLGI